MSDFIFSTAPVLFAEDYPPEIPQPKFRLGERVVWSHVPDPDFGRIIGVIFAHEASCRATGLHYLILLDENSPSRSICAHDFALEDDIKLLNELLPGSGDKYD